LRNETQQIQNVGFHFVQPNLHGGPNDDQGRLFLLQQPPRSVCNLIDKRIISRQPGTKTIFAILSIMNGFFIRPELGCLKNRIYGIFISPIFGTIDHAGIYSLQNLIFDLIL
jgi:hypothetical protein